MRIVKIAAALIVAACSSDMGATPGPDAAVSPFIDGFVVDPPAPGQIQVYTPPTRELAVGEDVTFCTYLDYTTDRDMDVVAYKGYQSIGGHHVILYAANQKKPTGTHECT